MQNKIINTSRQAFNREVLLKAKALAAIDYHAMNYEYDALATYELTAEAKDYALEASKAYNYEANNYSFTDDQKDIFTTWAEASAEATLTSSMNAYMVMNKPPIYNSVLSELHNKGYNNHLYIKDEAFADAYIIAYTYYLYLLSLDITEVMNKKYDAKADKKYKAKAKYYRVKGNAAKVAEANANYFTDTLAYNCNHKCMNDYMNILYGNSYKYFTIYLITKANDNE
jgi:hypothetical protein